MSFSLKSTVFSMVFPLFSLLGLGLFESATQAADVLELKNGGRLQGQFLIPPQGEDLVYRFRTIDGIELEISRSEVESVDKKGSTTSVEEYEKLKSQMTDDVEGNLKMAQWCAENQMLSQRKAHYERVLELDSDNEKARHALGFKRMIDGKWRTSNDEMEEQGKVKVKGKWVSIQEKELLEKNKAEKLKTRKIAADIKKWVKGIGTRNEESCIAELENLRDPSAVPGLQDAYSKEKRPPVRKIIIKCLGRIGSPAALDSLLQLAVDEKNEELRLTALDNLIPNKGPGMTEYFIKRLSPKRSTHEQINYAAYALGVLKDSSAVPALIGALETTHKFQVVTGNSGGQTSAGMGQSSNGSGGMGFSMGSSVHTIVRQMQNPEVLEALKKLTDVNFFYDQHRWIQWYQQKSGGAGAMIRPEE